MVPRVAASFFELNARESPASQASNAKDVPPDGYSLEGNLDNLPSTTTTTPGGGQEKKISCGRRNFTLLGAGQVLQLKKSQWEKNVGHLCLDPVPRRVALAVVSMLRQGTGVIVSQCVTGNAPPSSFGRMFGSPKRASCSWPAGLKGCVFGQNDPELLVSYHPLTCFLGFSLVSVGVSSGV